MKHYTLVAKVEAFLTRAQSPAVITALRADVPEIAAQFRPDGALSTAPVC